MARLTLEVATPRGKALSIDTASVQVPSAMGEFGVLPGHLPILAVLKPGVLSYEVDGRTARAAISTGFVEADASGVRVITEDFAGPKDVDAKEATAEVEAATEAMKALACDWDDPAMVKARRRLDWANARATLAATSSN